ncbi:unnamed protein product [Ranitomeya imitator]|uniref:Reverse transcriptase domain-containing protein n=1 Tax=Ranitomeya imitator TaxID=111125 RepID=A0ABN9MN92_9NEOB|nr:unnamed protein product [Ranitomeya imitator]
MPEEDRRVFRDLLELLDENEGNSGKSGRFTGRIPSQASPSFSLFPVVQIFFETVSRDIANLKINNKGLGNLTREEARCLKHLKKQDSFVIKEADKGGNIVLWPKDLYVVEAKRQLLNTSHYQVLPSDPTDVYKKHLDGLIRTALGLGIINKRERDFLTIETPRIPTFYMLPKVHKSLDNPPGRPIISGIGGLFERPCVYLDYFLQPLVFSLGSYIRDSMHLIERIGKLEVPRDTLIITLDVESLYTSIDHKLGLDAITYFLDKKSSRDRDHDCFILDLLKMVLEKNYFIFDRTFYRQASGTAMGARCAPSYANLYMGWWEETHVYQLHMFQRCVLEWHRFIDDVLLLWTGTLDECNNFIDSLNRNPWNIRLTSKVSSTRVDFLDLNIILRDNHIVTSLHRKETATNSLLHYKSAHPVHLRNSIPKGQFLRVKRNCSAKEDFLAESRKLTERFRDRGYPHRVVAQAFQHSQRCVREDILKPREKKTVQTINLITVYHNQWRDVHEILKKNWNILLTEPKLHPWLAPTPRMVARRSRNLKDDLVSSHFKRATIKSGTCGQIFGSYPCGGCSICGLMISDTGITLPHIPKRIEPSAYFNCRTRYLVYALVCGCPKLYVGYTTQELRRRVQQHLSNINTAKKDLGKGKKLSSVAGHFLQEHGGSASSLRVMGLEGVRPDVRGGNITLDLLRRESKWIYNLNSRAPGGMNEELLFTGFYKQI